MHQTTVLKYEHLCGVGKFILKCMKQTERKPGCLHERALYELVANLRAGTRTFTPEVDELIYARGLDNTLYHYTSRQYEIERLWPLLDAMTVHGNWVGVGSDIDFEALPEPSTEPWWPRYNHISWRTFRWE